MIITPVDRMQIKSFLLATLYAALVLAAPGSLDSNPDDESSSKTYFIGFSDNATNEQFNSTLEWLKNQNISETEKAFQGYVKYIIAPLSLKQAKELDNLKQSYNIEDLEEDVYDEDSKHDEL